MLTTQHQKMKEKLVGARKRPHKKQKKNKTFNKFKTNSNKIKLKMLHGLLVYL